MTGLFYIWNLFNLGPEGRGFVACKLMDRQSVGSPATPLLTDYIKKPKPQPKDWGFLRLEFRWFGVRELRLESPVLWIASSVIL
ncbi:hypothetical protein CWO14_09180 [Vibrio splendidus]|nr:hypothetical protein A150_14165 [Vibrio splendidus 1S-124]PTQ19765.1 hypothetical protein CWO14_09180 [Vibrio splendidus]